jgi:hypothetical protein
VITSLVDVGAGREKAELEQRRGQEKREGQTKESRERNETEAVGYRFMIENACSPLNLIALCPYIKPQAAGTSVI